MWSEFGSTGIRGVEILSVGLVAKGLSRKWRREPLDGPGSAVDTIPMSSISFPRRAVGGGREGNPLPDDLLGDRLIELRNDVSIFSSLGRLAGLARYANAT